MKTSKAIELINKELSVLFGFTCSIPDEFKYMAVGVKLGKISATDAANKIKNLCTIKG